MSIVPYRPLDTGRIVYHDPTSQILVVHNNRNNSVDVFGSNYIESLELNQKDLPLFSPTTSLSVSQAPRRTNPPCCPNCGVDLTDFLAADEFSQGFASLRVFEGSRKGRSRSKSDANEYDLESFQERSDSEDQDFSRYFQNGHGLGFGAKQVQFMHHDYFQLLADLPYDAEQEGLKRAIRGAGSEVPRIRKDAGSKQEELIFNQGYFERFFQKVPPGILGCGAHAQVYKVAHVLKGIQLGIFAVKRINVGEHLHFLEQVLNEVLILYELSARGGANENNLIRYNHVWMEYGDLFDLSAYILNPEPGSQNQPTKVPYVYILQQYCDGGHLENLVSSNFLREEHMTMKQKLDEERVRRRGKSRREEEKESRPVKKWLSDIEIWKFFSDVTHGVAYLHAHGILHRDLKPSNCLLDVKYDAEMMWTSQSSLTEEEFKTIVLMLPTVLVSDFGEGKFLNKTQKESLPTSPDERRGNTGTIEFTDPKLWVFEDHSQYDGKPRFAHQFSYDSDIYSLGMILCYLCVGKLPFAEEITDNTNPEAVRNQIARWHADLTPDRFNDWFDRKNIVLKGEVSPVMEDFRVLIYLMIKGHNDAPKPSPKICAGLLDSIRWNRFIVTQNRRRSEATIVEMGNLSGSLSTGEVNSAGLNSALQDELEDEAMGETLDLVSLERRSLNSYAEKATILHQRRGYKRLFIRLVYVLNLLLMDLCSPSTRPHWALAIKIGNLISLAGESFIPAEHRILSMNFWVLATLATVIYQRRNSIPI